MSTTAETQDAEATAATPEGTDTAEPGRMWRKVVAFEWPQKAYLDAAADLLAGDDHGNVSAVIRAAIDEYAARHPVAVPAAQQEG